MTFCRTRLVIDEVAVMKDMKVAYERGWMVWNASYHWARRLREEQPKPDVDSKHIQGTRADRWPRSKHLYYDRFIGKAECISKEHHVNIPRTIRKGNEIRVVYTRERRVNFHASCVWKPHPDAMDQRTSVFATRSILPTDDALLPIHDVRIVYWQQWTLDVLEQDGYYDAKKPVLGPVYKRLQADHVKKAKV